jgi:DNA-directed RNA polymerase specialized sigma subunit
MQESKTKLGGRTRLETKDRNNRLVLYMINHPTMTLESVGRIFHISASRVCRIRGKYTGTINTTPVEDK